MKKPSTSKTPENDRKKILIVDDHPITRQGLAQLINFEPDLQACCEASTASEAMSEIKKCRPSLVLLDITLPDKNGIELIKDILTMYPNLPVLVISMHDESSYAERVLRAGGRGYIMKQEGGKKLMIAIRRVLEGQIYVSEKMSARLLETFSGKKIDEDPFSVGNLTDREFEVFELIGEGLSTKEIAQRLHLSVKTIEVHRLHIKEKLNLKTANELIRYAVRWTESQTEAKP